MAGVREAHPLRWILGLPEPFPLLTQNAIVWSDNDRLLETARAGTSQTMLSLGHLPLTTLVPTADWPRRNHNRDGQSGVCSRCRGTSRWYCPCCWCNGSHGGILCVVAGVPARPCVLYQLICDCAARFVVRDNCCGEAFRDDGRWHSWPIIIALDLIAVDLKRLNGFLIILIRPYLLDLHWN